MRQYLATYPYLAACLGGACLLGVLLLFSPGQRKSALWSGLLGTPLGLCSFLMVPDYWEPRWVWSAGRVGLEDLLFSFVFAACSWLIATWVWRRRLRVRLCPSRMLIRYTACMVSGVIVFWLALKCLQDPMSAALLGLWVGVGIHLILNPDRWRLAVSGALGFGVVYVLYLKLLLILMPNFISSWNLEGPWGTAILGVPHGEMVWAVTYGACWTLCCAFLFQAEWQPSTLSPLPIDRKGLS